MAELDPGRDAVTPVGEGDSPTSLATCTPGLLPGSPNQETDLGAFASTDTPLPSKLYASSDSRATMRGSVLAPANSPGLSHPGGVDDRRLRPVVRGTFTMRGELMHCFVSYRVTTEGMALTRSSAKTCALLHSCPLRAPAAHRAPLTP